MSQEGGCTGKAVGIEGMYEKISERWLEEENEPRKLKKILAVWMKYRKYVGHLL